MKNLSLYFKLLPMQILWMEMGRFFLCPDDYTVMEKNKKYILFLAKDDENEGYWIKALNQGKFNIDNTDIREQKLSKENELFGQLKKDVLKKYKDEF